jgi:hypothetical protein
MTDGTEQRTRQPTTAGFFVGATVMLVFAVAGLGGSYWAFDHIALKHALVARGKAAEGVVLSKRQIDSRAFPASTGHAYQITYRFMVGGRAIQGTSRVDREMFFELNRNGPIRVSYLPAEPKHNLPEAYLVTGIDWFFGLFGLAVGGAAFVILVGMGVARGRKP